MEEKIPYFKTPEGKIKNRNRAKRNYEKIKNNIIECVACNKSFNDKSIISHIKTKMHSNNKSKLVEESNDDVVIIVRRIDKKEDGDIWWSSFEVVNKSIN